MLFSARVTLMSAALLGMTAVMLGAFGAHALRDLLEPRFLAVWQTAVQYQFWHVAALLAVGCFQQRTECRWLGLASLGFILGIVIFSGSLYLMALTGFRPLGMVTPVGGVLFILAWLSLFISFITGRTG